MSESSNAPWYQFYGNIPRHLDYPHLTMYQLILDTAKKHPNLPAYDFMDRKTGYRQFIRKIDCAAKALYALGIRKNDRVTICLPNIPQAIDCFYALNRIGAVSSMIHPMSATQEILSYLNQSKSKAILTLDSLFRKVCAAAEMADCKPLILVARIEDELQLQKKIGLAFSGHKKSPIIPLNHNVCFWSEVVKNTSVRLPKDDGKYTDCASILYSGGTTGAVKGICLSNLNFNALALQTIAASGYQSICGKTMLSVMPIFHGFGLGIGIHTPFVGGACCILLPKFSSSGYAKLLRKKRPNFIPGVPTIFEALLRTKKLEKLDMSFLMGVFCGGDSLSGNLKCRVDAFLSTHRANVQIREGYGTTECVTASCLTPVSCAREGSIGIPFPDIYYKIVKTGTTETLPADEEGEICISGPTVMMGYSGNPEETKRTLQRHADGRIWLHTGDLGKMDKDGFVYFRQRIKRMIVTSGYNVYPSQLETVINGYKKVQLSCVIGVKDSYRMQRVKAYIVLRSGYSGSDEVRDEIINYCRERVAEYAIPSEIEFRDTLPKTSVGKIAYRVLEQEAEGAAQ